MDASHDPRAHDPETHGPENGPHGRSERSTTGLISDLVEQFVLLLRQELHLLRVEVMGGFARVGRGAGAIVAGLLLAFCGLVYLLAAATLGLALVVAPWLAALIVGAAALLLGGAAIWFGRARLALEQLTPRRTLQTLKDDAEWAREQMR